MLNKGYYRDLVAYHVRKGFFRPLRFCLKNSGVVGARDVYVDFSIRPDYGELSMVSIGRAQLLPPSKSWITFSESSYRTTPEAEPERRGDHWGASLEIRALQPQREVSPPTWLVIGASKSTTVTIAARIYADSLSEPVTRTLKIRWKVQQASIKAAELLQNLNELPNNQLADAKRSPAN
jgi:hypothetical protein